MKGASFPLSSTGTGLSSLGACCCSSCVSQVSKMKLAIAACCGLTLRILYHTPFKTMVFSKGKENILCYLEFSTVTLCPRVTCPSEETFSIMQYFFNSVVYIYRGRQLKGETNKWKNCLRFLSECRARMIKKIALESFRLLLTEDCWNSRMTGGHPGIFLMEKNVILSEGCDWKYL